MVLEAKYQLLISHALSAWGDRMWSFSIGLYLVILSPTSLELTAIYGLILAVSILLLGSTIGLWIDSTPRLTAAKVALAIQNSSVVLCCILLCLTLTYGPDWEDLNGPWVTFALQAVVILTADVASLFSEAQKIILERDWIVVIAGKDPSDLAKMNSMFRSIDLITLILAPLLVGGIMSWFSQVAAAIFIATWNVVSLAVEYAVLTMVFRKVPELGASKKLESSSDEVLQKSRSWIKDAIHAWKLYFEEPVAVAGFGLACVYMSVLGYDSVTSGYLYSQGVPEWAVGLANGSGAVFGILGALAFPILHRLFSLRTSAIIGFGSFAIIASGAVASCWLPGSSFILHLGPAAVPAAANSSGLPTAVSVEVTESLFDNFYLNPSVMTFIICLVVSRTALWIADLSVTQSIQETVDASLRGEINGVQSSLNNSMEVLKFGLVALLPEPRMFGYLVIVSEAFYVIGWICSCRYSWSYNRRTQAYGRMYSQFSFWSSKTGDDIEETDFDGRTSSSGQPSSRPTSTSPFLSSGKEEYGTFTSGQKE